MIRMQFGIKYKTTLTAVIKQVIFAFLLVKENWKHLYIYAALGNTILYIAIQNITLYQYTISIKWM